MSLVLKIKFNTETHRVMAEKDDLSFEAVCKAIEEIYGEKPFLIKYRDEDDDMCTLCPNTFMDWLSHSAEQNGRQVLKVELLEPASNGEGKPWNALPMPAKRTSEMCAEEEQDPVMNDFGKPWKMFKGMFKASGKGAGKWGLHHWHHGAHHGQHEKYNMKMIKYSLAELYKSGLLDADTFATLVIKSLPQIINFIAEKPEKVNWKLGKKAARHPFFDDLCSLIASTEGLESCQHLIAEWREEQRLASEVLLEFLPALMSLSFDAQIQFVQALYTSQETELKAMLEKKAKWMAMCKGKGKGDWCGNEGWCGAGWWSKEAWLAKKFGVAENPSEAELKWKAIIEKKAKWMAMCKGKGKGDWCGKEGWCGKEWCGNEAWLAKKTGVAENPKEAELKLKAMLEKKGRWMAVCKGKGKNNWCGKGDGKAQGMRCSKDWYHDSSEWKKPARSCAREGCAFAVTWHATHCCAACATGKGHGKCCAKEIVESQAAPETPKLSAREGCEPEATWHLTEPQSWWS